MVCDGARAQICHVSGLLYTSKLPSACLHATKIARHGEKPKQLTCNLILALFAKR